MATEYTDVDRLILARWQDVIALSDAHEELQDRIEETIEEVGERLGRSLEDRGFSLDTQTKVPSIFIGHDDWWHKRKDYWTIYFEIGAFAPLGFRKVKDPHPYAWLHTSNLEFLKMKDVERAEFARALRVELGDQAQRWVEKDVVDDESPLGHYYKEFSDVARVELVADPDKLFDFTMKACEDLFTLTEPIERVLAKFRPKE